MRVRTGACGRTRCRSSGKGCGKGQESRKGAGRGEKNHAEDENKGGREDGGEMTRGPQLASKGVGRGRMKRRRGEDAGEGPAFHAKGEKGAVTSHENTNTVGILRDGQAQCETSVLAEGGGRRQGERNGIE